METFLIIVSITVVAIILGNKIQMINIRLEILKKELNRLRETLEKTIGSPEVISENIIQKTVSTETEITSIPEPDILTDQAPEVIVEAEPIFSPQPPPPPILPISQKTITSPIPPKRKINYEKLIGENLFGKIGILILVIGIGLFVKYAIDNEWINETIRTILGFMVGSGLLFVAERLHQKYRTFSSLLAGGAFAIFYVTTAIAYHYYGLFSQTAAFVILVVTTILMSILSLLYNRRELAMIAIIGGFIAPFLTSNSEGNYIVLFTYILILNGGMFILSIYKKWGELPLAAFVFTWICMFIYWLTQSIYPNSAAALLLFSTLYFLLFLFPIISVLKNTSGKINRFLLGSMVLNNFIYMAFGIVYLEVLFTIRLNGFLTLFIALVNLGVALWLKKTLQDPKHLLYVFLAVTVTFVSMTIPLQLEGNYITIFWAAEMVMLFYLSQRSGYLLYEYFSYALALLTFISWRIDTVEALNYSNAIFVDKYFVSNLFTSITYLAYAYLLNKSRIQQLKRYYTPLNAIILGLGYLLFWYAWDSKLESYILNENLAFEIRFFFSGCYLLALSYILQKRFPIHQYILGYIAGCGLNICLFLYAYHTSANTWSQSLYGFIAWIYWVIILIHIFLTSRTYYLFYNFCNSQSTLFTVGLNIIIALLGLTATSLFLSQIALNHEFKSGFSICLALLGFIQMSLGMRLHLRLLRIISLVTFGIILAKLICFDLWLLPTVGKIIVLIILGTILLILSFMYQKLKNVLFKEDHVE